MCSYITNTYKNLHTHCFIYLFPYTVCIKRQYALLQLCSIFQNLSWWSYDSGRRIPVLVRSPWHKVDLCWFLSSNP